MTDEALGRRYSQSLPHLVRFFPKPKTDSFSQRLNPQGLAILARAAWQLLRQVDSRDPHGRREAVKRPTKITE